MGVAAASRNRPRRRRRPREGRGTLIRRVSSQRLEGSRFGLRPAALADFASTLIPRKRAKTGGSRERLNGSQVYAGAQPIRVRGEPSRRDVSGSRLLPHVLSD